MTPRTTRSKPAAMAAAKPANPPAGKAAATRASKPAPGRGSSPATASGPFLRFHHSEALREKTLQIVDALENATDPTRHRHALADLVVELTSAGMDYYFIQQLRLAKAGFVVQQSANVGMIGALKMMGGVIRSIIGRMDDAQLRSVCASIRHLSR